MLDAKNRNPKETPLSPNTGESPELKKAKDLPSPLVIPESPEVTLADPDVNDVITEVITQDPEVTQAEISSFLHQFDEVLNESGDGAVATMAVTDVAATVVGTTVPPSPGPAEQRKKPAKAVDATQTTEPSKTNVTPAPSSS